MRRRRSMKLTFGESLKICEMFKIRRIYKLSKSNKSPALKVYSMRPSANPYLLTITHVQDTKKAG